MKRAILFFVLLALTSVARAEPPDLTPVRCAWGALPPEEQKRLRDAFQIDNSANVYRHEQPSDEETYAAAQSCRLNYTTTQIKHMAAALGWKAREEVSRMGIAARGLVKPVLIDRALGNLDDDRRVEIGDRLSCRDYRIDGGWDRSIISAIRRTGTKTMDGPSVAYIGLGVYALLAQEGYMRRLFGIDAPCPPLE